MQSNPNFISTIEWVSQHIHLFGWTTLIAFVWKLSRYLTQIEVRAHTAEEHIMKMATNELPHIQTAMESVDENVKGLREDFKDFFLNR